MRRCRLPGRADSAGLGPLVVRVQGQDARVGDRFQAACAAPEPVPSRPSRKEIRSDYFFRGTPPQQVCVGHQNRAPADDGGSSLRAAVITAGVSVTTTSQPLLALASAADATPPLDQQVSRLLTLWTDLAQRAISAAAHDSGDERALREMQMQVEVALAERLPDHSGLIDELVIWEASLLHTAQTPPETCLTCRKARLGLPADLPIPAHRGGAR